MWLVKLSQFYRGSSLILVVNVYESSAVVDGPSYFESFDGKTKFPHLRLIFSKALRNFFFFFFQVNKESNSNVHCFTAFFSKNIEQKKLLSCALHTQCETIRISKNDNLMKENC